MVGPTICLGAWDKRKIPLTRIEPRFLGCPGAKDKGKGTLNLQSAMKAQQGSRGTALFFL